MNWQKVLERLSVPGMALLVLGAVAASQAKRMFHNERLVLIVRIAGMVLAMLGAVILLDWIPGM